MKDDFEKIVNGIVEDVDDLSEDQIEQQTEQLQKMTKDTLSLGKETSRRVCQIADTLDALWENCTKVHVAGTSTAVLGGILAVGGGIATLMSAGVASPLVISGLAFGFGGAFTNIGASFIEGAMSSKEIKKAESDLQEAIKKIKKMEESLQEWFKKSGKLLNGVGHLHCWIRGLTPNGVKTVCAVLGDLADDALGATAKASGQAADDIAGASVKAGAKEAAKLQAKVIIGVSAAFLVWDVIVLGCSIHDLVNKRGSDAAKILREKAAELDEICSLWAKWNTQEHCCKPSYSTLVEFDFYGSN